MKLAALILACSTPLTAITPAASDPDPAATGKILEDFDEKAAEGAWRVVTDGVMGGISRGRLEVAGGVLVFTGETRLENRGGFSSIRSLPRDWRLGGAQEISLRMRGTASRGYTMLLRAGEGERGRTASYWQPFELQGEGWQTVRLPLADFYPTWRGRRLRGPELDISAIRSVGLMVNDKKAGPFKVEIDWIKAGRTDAEARSDAMPSIAAIAAEDARFSTLLTAVKAAGLADTLAGAGPFTLMAPTNEAFARLPETTLQDLLLPRNREQLRAVLLHHVIPGSLRADQLAAAGPPKPAFGESVPVRIEGGRLKVAEATIIANDLEAANGLVHVIDTVLIPSSLPATDPVAGLIEAAVSRGSDLFNRGEVEACAAIYEVTATALLGFEAPKLAEETRHILGAALEAARRDHDHRAAAWTIRRALDAAWTSASR